MKYPDSSNALLTGCSCGSRFFFFYKENELNKEEGRILNELENLSTEQRGEIEHEIETDVQEIIDNMDEKPVILDLESIRILKPGKFEIDLVSLFKRKPLVYKLAEGKYIIDLASTFQLMQKGGKKAE
jgi:predicted  nucleic acid-binding Zn-ribbon protein